MSAFFNTITENELVSQVLGRCGITRRKVFQYVSLFCVLIVIYSICFSMFLKVASASPTHAQLDALFAQIGKVCLVGALPFAILAYSDKTWRSSDAAPVCAGAWIAVYEGFSFNGKICALGVALPFLGLVLCALLAHGLGILCRLAQRREWKPSYHS